MNPDDIKINPYEVLGVSRDATSDEIKKAYKRLCGKFHPDKGGDEAKFKAVQEAYKKITEPEKSSRVFSDNGFSSNTFDFSELFPIQFSIDVTLEDLFEGKIRRVNLPTGESFNLTIPAGHLPHNPIQKLVSLSSGKRKNIICSINLIPHKVFELEGSNLRCQREISLIEYYEGTRIQIKTLANKTFNVKIVPNKPVQTIRMAGQGFRSVQGQHTFVGDLFIDIKVKLPTLNEEQITSLKLLLEPKEVEETDVQSEETVI